MSPDEDVFLQHSFPEDLFPVDLEEDFVADGILDYSPNQLTFSELYHTCVQPTVTQICNSMYMLLIANATFGLLLLVQQCCMNFRLFNCISFLLGILATYSIYGHNCWYLFVFVVFAFCILRLVLLLFVPQLNMLVVVLFIIAYSMSCELYFSDKESWHQLRGSMIILSMKVISLSADVFDRKTSEKTKPKGYDCELCFFHMSRNSDASVFHQFIGYCFHPGSVIFGPWIPYDLYAQSVENSKSSLCWNSLMSWLRYFGSCLILSFICFVYSTCISVWLIPSDLSHWIDAYRDAQAFRFGHYFVCYFSCVTLLLCGVTNLSTTPSSITCPTCAHYQQVNPLVHGTTHPLRVEFPRSLVDVVAVWNLPMHFWLKNFVFRRMQHLGLLAAVLLTFVASSLLHGVNFQLAAVLLSLGVYSYVENRLRNQIGRLSQCCCLARPCASYIRSTASESNHLSSNAFCSRGHCRLAGHPLTKLINFFFTLLAMWHLAYLGLLFDTDPSQSVGYSAWHTLSKWANLGFLSHFVVGFCFAISLTIDFISYIVRPKQKVH